MEKCMITEEYVRTMIRERPRELHKGQSGRVLVVAGSVGMAGAAALTVGGALKSGAGLVKVAVPRELFTILQVLVPQAMCISRDNFLIPDDEVPDLHTEDAHEDLGLYDSIAIGPGLGISEGNYNVLAKILREYRGTIVLDADGLNTLCRYDRDLKTMKSSEASIVITPHPGEARRLLSAIDAARDSEGMGRDETAEFLSGGTHAVTLLKGPDTVVSSVNEGTYVNTTGNQGMAKGGSGDVLTGVIAAIAGYGIKALDAAKTGAFIHGLAGDMAAEKKGQWAMTSADIVDCLPDVFMKIVGK